MCTYTKTSWKGQEWQLYWTKNQDSKDVPKFAAGFTNANMETAYGANQDAVITTSGWDLEASYLNVLSSKQVLLDLTRV